YVYYYPGLPIRAAHVRNDFPGCAEWMASGASGLGPAARDTPFDRRAAVCGWLDLTAKMLVLGYLPTTRVHTGNCMHEHNLVIGGGVCDIDSIERMRDVREPKDFAGGLLCSLMQLSGSVGAVLLAGVGDAFTVDQLAWGAVWSEIRQRVRREPRYAHCDPRLRDAVEREGVTELEGLAAIFAGPSSRSEEHTSELQSLTNLVCRLLLETQ